MPLMEKYGQSEELSIEESDLKSLIEYNFEGCARVGLKVFTQNIFENLPI